MSYQFEDLKGKVAIITGSGRGIGRGIAQKLAENGVNVVISDVDSETCEQAAKEIAQNQNGVETLSSLCDVTNRDQVDTMVQNTVQKWGRLDILVNNAGITMDKLLATMKPEQWQKVIDINLTGVFNVSQAALKVMSKARSGNIVTISSIARFGNPGQANYAATKAGVVAFSNTIAGEFAARGIRSNCIAPGFISTPMTDAMPEKLREAVLKQIPLKRPGKPEDIAKAVLFLVSDLSSYVTGQTLEINGGLMGL